MKSTLVIILIILLSSFNYAQKIAYYPNGTKVKFKYETYGDLLDSVKLRESTLHIGKNNSSVYFKRLSNIPVLVFTDSPKKIKSIVASYDYKRYLNSYSYYYDLRDMMRKGSLTKEYLSEVFGKPDQINKNEDSTENWIFKNYNAKIVLERDTVKSVNVINFKALERNELGYSDFQVTGSDYTMGFNISLLNLSNNTIKYAYVTVTATNPVDDKIGTKTVTAIGPITSNSAGSYNFDDIFYSSSAKYLEIDRIKIQYMNGKTRSIPKSEIRNIQIQNWEEFGNRTVGD